LIGAGTAEFIKINVGVAVPGDQLISVEVKGIDLVSGIPKVLTMDSDEVRKAISELINIIVETVLMALEQTPPELAADLIDSGIVLAGGGAMLKSLDLLLREKTLPPIFVAENPLSTVAVGAGKALSNLSILKNLARE